jgi:predicted aconitase with swiveling domain
MTASGSDLRGRTLAPGAGRGPVVALEEPLSLWGGMDPQTGIVIDQRHPQAGTSLAGRVVVMPSGRGSSSSSSILAEAIRAGSAPVAIILREADPILAIGAIVAEELYGRSIPIVVLDEDSYDIVTGAALLEVDAVADGATVRSIRGR